MAVVSTRESLLLLKREITSEIRSCMSGKERYNHVVRAANEHSELQFEDESYNSFEWKKTDPSLNFNAASRLRESLRDDVYSQILPHELSDLSQIMNDWAGVDGLGTLVYNYKTDRRKVKEFAVIEHVGDDESQIKVHYLKLSARGECSRVLFFSRCSMELRAEYRVATFRIKNALLQHRRDSIVQRALEFIGRI